MLLRRLTAGFFLIALAGVLASSPASHAAEPPSAPLLRIETGMHTATINRIAVDAAERFMVTGSDDKTARVWELATGKLLQVLRPPQGEGDEGKVYAVAFSPDGATVAVAGWTEGGENSDNIYLFDRAGGKILRRLAGLPNVINHLAFSPDGKHLAAALGRANGVRVYRTLDWQQVAEDAEYGTDSYSADFARDGRLVTTSYDGYLRLYDRSFKLIAKERAPGGKEPFSARFSPDGRLVAVGFKDSTAVNVLSGEDLTFRYAPNTTGVNNGNLVVVTWSQDGRFLYAGGRFIDTSGWCPILRWGEAGRGIAQRWRAATSTIMDLKALSGGRLAFGAADPAFGVLDVNGHKVLVRRGEILDHRDNQDKLLISADGAVVEFGFDTLTTADEWSRRRGRFDLAGRRLSLDPSPLTGLQAPRTEGQPKENWKDATTPRVLGRALALKAYETSRSLAFAADGQHFVLGTEWYLRFYDRSGKERWNVPVPAIAWAVNLSADGRYAVAAFGDGTVRWYGTEKGREGLALFVHPDGKRWIAWTPEGFFDAAPGGQELIGYHLNQGKDRAGEFVGAGQLAQQFYRPDLIAQRLGPGGDKAVADAVQRLGDVRQVLAQGLPPKVELLSPAQSDIEGEYVFKARFKDQGGGIGRFIYRIDGVEIEGRPADIPGAGADTVGRRFSLAPGRRVVSLTVANSRGVESQPVQAVVNVKAREERPALFVLAVGVTKYRDHSLAQGVRFAADDARTVAERLKVQGEGFFRTVVARSLRDQEATRANIEARMKEMTPQVRPEDVFVVYLAGHGAALDGEYHFLPWEVRFTSREALHDQGLNQEALRKLLQMIPAKKTLLLLDTCSSGAFAMGPARGLDDKLALDRLSRISGRATLAASGSEQMALEGEQGHGVFTHALLEGLKKADRNGNGLIEVGELADFIEELVPAITKSRWGYEQFPIKDLKGASFPVGRRP